MKNVIFQVDTKLTQRLEADSKRPYDYQDRVVIAASLAALVCLAVILAL